MKTTGRATRNLMACALVVAVLLSTLAATGCLGGGPSHVPAPNLTIVSWDAERTLLGDGRFTVEVRNLGDATGSKIIHCEVMTEDIGYSATQLAVLEPGEAKTYTITVDVPLEDYFTSLDCSCYLD